MNVQCKVHDKKIIVSSENSVRVLPNLDNILTILKDENVLELLKFYYDRDSERYKELIEEKGSSSRIGIATSVGCLSVAGVSYALGLADVIPDVCAITVGTGAIASTAAYSVLRKHVGTKNFERDGLSECLKYQEDKINRLIDKIAKSYKKGVTVDEPDKSFLVDDRLEKDRLNRVLNFIFYMGCHRNKVKKIVKNFKLRSFLNENFGINDIDSVVEIESYVYKEFSDEFDKAYGSKIK